METLLRAIFFEIILNNLLNSKALVEEYSETHTIYIPYNKREIPEADVSITPSTLWKARQHQLSKFKNYFKL